MVAGRITLYSLFISGGGDFAGGYFLAYICACRILCSVRYTFLTSCNLLASIHSSRGLVMNVLLRTSPVIHVPVCVCVCVCVCVLVRVRVVQRTDKDIDDRKLYFRVRVRV